jgi:hypothetical protein
MRFYSAPTLQASASASAAAPESASQRRQFVSRMRTPRRTVLIAVAAPVLVFLLHSSLLWDWIVDDAGISFAYARNFVDGHGLVAQPGLEAVEGYSNPLWVALMVPFMFAGLFEATLVPKLLSLLLVGGAFAALYRTMALAVQVEVRDKLWAAAVPALPLLLLAVNTSFVVWTTSGLENPLYVLLLSLLLLVTMGDVIRERFTPASAASAGLVAAALAMTRPDGVIFAAAYPLVMGAAFALRWRAAGAGLRPFAAYALCFCALMAAFLAFRLLYFDDGFYPNTYHAKGGVSGAGVDDKLGDLAESVFGLGPVPGFVLLGLAAAGLFVFRRPGVNVAGVFTLIAAGGVLLLPQDWMRENRYCSLFVMSFYALLSLQAFYAARAARRHLDDVALASVGAVSLIVLLASTGGFVGRSLAFSRSPTVPMSDVQTYFGDRFAAYARFLGVENPSILTPDVGGLLYGSQLRVYDLGGLTDERIARTLTSDLEAFHAYVLDELKPTFIHTHGAFAVWASFDTNPRFRAEYRAICEGVDPWVRETWNFNWYAGDYVRWEHAPQDATIAEMAKQCRKTLPYPAD